MLAKIAIPSYGTFHERMRGRGFLLSAAPAVHTNCGDFRENSMSAVPSLPTRRGGRFLPGQSGNPKGRPPGSRNAATIAVEKLRAGEAQELTRKAIDMAKKGNAICMRLCLERVAPRRKECPIVFDLPPITCPEDAERAGAAVVAAMAAGRLTAQEAGSIMAVLVAHTELVAAGSYGRRLAALEAARREEALQ